MEELDLRTVRFIDTINDNLVCCICQNPFVEPVISNCGHTFCRYCIQLVIEATPVCPIDRASLTLDELQPAARIISNMVNELLVYCPNMDEGCTHTGQRQFIRSHLKNQCEYTLAPCQLEECKEFVLKKDLGSHAETCKFRKVECNMCKDKMCSYELEDHYDLCPSEIIQCTHCESSHSRSDHVSHITECPQLDIPCPHAEFGCLWNDKRQHLEKHSASCPYEAVKHYLYKQKENENKLKEDMQELWKENKSLKQSQFSTQVLISSIIYRLDRLTPGHDLYDPSMSETRRDEAIRSQTDRLANEVENLATKIIDLELQQKTALLKETFALQEELQKLRSSCFNSRMQVHYLTMKLENTLDSTVVVSNNPVSASNNNSSSSAADKLRIWLDSKKQETKL